jgi:hypothetical protein
MGSISTGTRPAACSAMSAAPPKAEVKSEWWLLCAYTSTEPALLVTVNNLIGRPRGWTDDQDSCSRRYLWGACSPPGDAHDNRLVMTLLSGLKSGAMLLADRGFLTPIGFPLRQLRDRF